MWPRLKSRLGRGFCGFMALLLVVMAVVNPISIVPAYADASADVSYRYADKTEVEVLVQSDNASILPGDEISLNVGIRNNSAEELTAGKLSWSGSVKILTDAGFVLFDEETENAPEIDEDGNATNITIGAGETFELLFVGTVDEEIDAVKKGTLNFEFEGCKADESKVKAETEFKYTVGLVTLEAVTFVDGSELTAGETHTMVLQLNLEEIEVHTDSNTATDSDADEKTPSNADFLQINDITCTLETYGVEFENVKVVGVESDESGLVVIVTLEYEVSEDTVAGSYFGNVTAEVKIGSKSYEVTQGFEFSVVEDGTVTVAAHLETCVEGCTSEGCDCECHATAREILAKVDSLYVQTHTFTEDSEYEEMYAVYEALFAMPDEMDAAYDNGELTDAEYGYVQSVLNVRAEEIIAMLAAVGFDPYAIMTLITYYQYCHLDIRVAATITITTLNADGTQSTDTVTGSISSPSAVIYNTGSTSWSTSGDGTKNGYKYVNVSYNKTSTDTSGGTTVYEYQSTVGHAQGSTLEFYDGDTVELTYTLTYTYNGVQHSVNLTETVVVAETNNKCNSNSSYGKEFRGFDIELSGNDVSSAMSESMIQIGKVWDDNGYARRPETIGVTIYRTVNGTKNAYLDLTLYATTTDTTEREPTSSEKTSNYTAADYEGVTLTLSNNYGVIVEGLPQNYWVKNETTEKWEYVSCSYSVEEVDAGSVGTGPVYGSFVYVDKQTETNYVISITNTLAYEKLGVKKVWEDTDAVDHSRDSVTVKLYAYYTDSERNEQTVPEEWLDEFIGDQELEITLDSSMQWTALWGNMPVYYNEYPISGFAVEETSINSDEEYTVTYSEIVKGSDGNYYFTVTNSAKPKTTDVTVSKTVTGNWGSRDEEFDFTISVTDDDGNDWTDYTITRNDSTTFTSGSFKLKHGQSIVIGNVPIGGTVIITENANGYTASIDVTAGNSVTENIKEDKTTASVTVSNLIEGSEIAFTNSKSAIIDTGITMDSIPYILILAAVVGGIAFYVIRKRKDTDLD